MKFLFAIIPVIILLSCADKKDQWLQRYAQTKCAYQAEKEKIKSDSLNELPALIVTKEELQKKRTKIAAPYKAKIDQINFEIKNLEKDYLSTYRKLQDEQSLKHGHMSTPDYETKLRSLQSKRDLKYNALQKQIAEIKTELENNTEYLSFTNKMEKQENKIKRANENILLKHKETIDSLQEALDVSNNNFKKVKSDLSKEEQIVFENKRDSIRRNPCM